MRKTRKRKLNYHTAFHRSITARKKEAEPVCLVRFQNIEKDVSKNETLKTSEEVQRAFLKGFETPFSNTKFKGNENFYRYINYSWIQMSIKKKGLVQMLSEYDNFRIGQEKVNDQLNEIIQDYMKKNNNKRATNMKHFYNSLQTYNSKRESEKYAKEATEMIDELRKDKNNLWKLLGIINKNEILKQVSPVVWRMSANEKNTKEFASHILPHQFPVLNTVIFEGSKENPEVKRQMKEYHKYLNEVFSAVLGKNHDIRVDDIYDVEKQIYEILLNNQEERLSYFKILKDESLQETGFDWIQVANEIGYKEAPSFYITPNKKFLKAICEVLKEEWNSEKWRPFWLLVYYRFIVRYTREWKWIYFNYFGKFQRGISGDWFKSISMQSVLLLSYPFKDFLSEQYCAKYNNLVIHDFVSGLAKDLQAVFVRILKRNNWMSPKTKAMAIKKISSLKFNIGHVVDNYAIKTMPDPELDYSSTKIIENLNKISDWKTKKLITLDQTKYFELSSIDWSAYPFQLSGRISYIVNAYYSVFENSITVSLGYLQSPFVDLNNMGLEYNLATIGFTLAHEMSHALDSIGRHFDANGNLNDWWSDKDWLHYQKIEQDVLRQYETFAKRDGIQYNARLSLSEDLADISAVAICEEYLRDYILKAEAIRPVKYLNFRSFYDYFAFILRQHIPKSAFKTQLQINPHPPDVYRVNVPLSRSLTFRAAYNVKKGDGMWWHNTNTIW